MTNEPTQSALQALDYETPLKQLESQIEQLGEDFNWNGFTVCFDGKHMNAIVAALRAALSRPEIPGLDEAEAVNILRFYVDCAPAFRFKPIGAPGSIARSKQDAHIAAEDAALAFLALRQRKRTEAAKASQKAAIPPDVIERVAEALQNVSSQLQLSSMARTGDPTQRDDMKMEAIWAGKIERIIALLSPYRKDGGSP